MPSLKGGLSSASQCLPHREGPPGPLGWEVQASAPLLSQAQGRPGGAGLSLKGTVAASQNLAACTCAPAWRVCTGMCKCPVQGHVLGHEYAHVCVQGVEVCVYERVPEGPVWTVRVSMCVFPHVRTHAVSCVPQAFRWWLLALGTSDRCHLDSSQALRKETGRVKQPTATRRHWLRGQGRSRGPRAAREWRQKRCRLPGTQAQPLTIW